MTLNQEALDIFDGHAEGFIFACPGVLLSSDKVLRDYSNGLWRLSYQDSDRVWDGEGEELTLAYLDLIKNRMEI